MYKTVDSIIQNRCKRKTTDQRTLKDTKYMDKKQKRQKGRKWGSSVSAGAETIYSDHRSCYIRIVSWNDSFRLCLVYKGPK